MSGKESERIGVEKIQRQPAGYQIMLVGLLSLNFGILFFDRNALNFLMPFVQPDLGLSNTQVGMLSSALSLTWAISGFLVGRLSDRTGSRKMVIVVATLAFSVCSFVSGVASSFLMLLGAQLLMGFAEGGVRPISQSLIAFEVSPERRGLAMGVTQNMGSNLLGSTVAPLLLVAIAAAAGWRSAFFVAALPGIILALAIWIFVREPKPPSDCEGAGQDRLSIAAAFAERNILLCAAISVLLISYLVICWSFMPLFLTRVRGFDPAVMIAVPLVGVILPLGAMFMTGSPWLLAIVFFFGWALNGVFPLFMATIPSETVNPRHTATVLGLVMGTGEVLGGVFGPYLAGMAADRLGLVAVLWIMFGLCIVAGLLALGLRETALRIVARAGPGEKVTGG